MFISAVDMTIVNVALPDISDDLGAGVGELQWVIDGFLVALAGLLLLGSGLADRFGRRLVFVCGMAGFGATSVLCALAPSVEALIAARALMGASAACVLPPALSLIAVMFPPDERPRALGIWATVAGAGLVIGPLLGGLLVHEFGWQAVFLVNVPVALVVVPAGMRVLPESTRPGTPPLDLLGILLSIVALAGVVFALIEGGDTGWGTAPVIVAGALGLAAGVGFVLESLARESPLFDVRVLTRPPVAAGAVAILGVYIGFMGTMFLLPQYLQYVQDRSVVAAGLVLSPLGLGTAVGARLNAPLLAALGARVTVVAGLVGLAGSIALFLLLGENTTVLLVIVATFLIGVLIALVVAPATAVIMNDLGEERAGDGGAVNQLARQVGGALGVAIIGTVFAASFTGRIEDSLGRLPEPERARAAESIEDAREVVGGLARPLEERLVERVDADFDSAAHLGFATSVAILLAAAAFGSVALPRGGASGTDAEP